MSIGYIFDDRLEKCLFCGADGALMVITEKCLTSWDEDAEEYEVVQYVAECAAGIDNTKWVNHDCPMMELGTYAYDTAEEAIRVWNREDIHNLPKPSTAMEDNE